jgi:hypothetical protein
MSYAKVKGVNDEDRIGLATLLRYLPSSITYQAAWTVFK